MKSFKEDFEMAFGNVWNANAKSIALSVTYVRAYVLADCLKRSQWSDMTVRFRLVAAKFQMAELLKGT